MSLLLRILLVVVSFLMAVYVIRKIRKAKLKIEYALFWIVGAGLLLILAVFPNIAITVSNWLGFISPINFILLFMIFILLLHEFYLTVRTSHLENMIHTLTQEIAIREKMKEDEKDAEE